MVESAVRHAETGVVEPCPLFVDAVVYWLWCSPWLVIARTPVTGISFFPLAHASARCDKRWRVYVRWHTVLPDLSLAPVFHVPLFFLAVFSV